MPKKPELGRDIKKSFDIMDGLLDKLKEFVHMPLKRGLISSKISDDQIIKLVNQSLEEAYSLINKIEDLKSNVSKAKPPNKNSRFAAQAVISKFLEDSYKNNLLIQ